MIFTGAFTFSFMLPPKKFSIIKLHQQLEGGKVALNISNKMSSKQKTYDE